MVKGKIMDAKNAGNLVLKECKNATISTIMELNNSFIVCIVPNNLKDGDISLDSFFKVEKSSGKVSEYSPVMDPEEFKKALKNIVYNN